MGRGRTSRRIIIKSSLRGRTQLPAPWFLPCHFTQRSPPGLAEINAASTPPWRETCCFKGIIRGWMLFWGWAADHTDYSKQGPYYKELNTDPSDTGLSVEAYVHLSSLRSPRLCSFCQSDMNTEETEHSCLSCYQAPQSSQFLQFPLRKTKQKATTTTKNPNKIPTLASASRLYLGANTSKFSDSSCSEYCHGMAVWDPDNSRISLKRLRYTLRIWAL